MQREAETVLSVRGLGRAYGDLEALRKLDLELAAGEVVALLGGNGSGKTTALRCIAGQLQPTRGTVRVAGADPHREPSGEDARRALAFVPDTPVFYRELSVEEHIRLVAAAYDHPDGAEQGLAVLAELGLEARRSALPRQLSSGQRQKTLLACTFARPFRVLLLDEPVLRLDPVSQRWLHARLAACVRQGVAVLLTTHQPEWAGALADRAVVLAEGDVVLEQDYEQFLASGGAARIGSAPSAP